MDDKWQRDIWLRLCSNECHVSAMFKFQTASPDPEAAINTGPSATQQISIIGVHYMLIGSTFLATVFAFNKISCGDTDRATLLITHTVGAASQTCLGENGWTDNQGLVNGQLLRPECRQASVLLTQALSLHLEAELRRSTAWPSHQTARRQNAVNT